MFILCVMLLFPNCLSRQCLDGLSIRRGTKIERDWVTAGLATSDDAELTAVSMGIVSASEKLRENFNLASNIHIYFDSINALNRATDCSAHSGQTWSVALMEVIGPWLMAFPDVSLVLHQVPKDAEWTPHFRVHEYVIF